MKLWKRLKLPKPKSEASKGELSLVDNEVYSGIEIPKMPFFVRLDGWSFHSLVKRNKVKKPFDKNFLNCFVETAKKFFTPFNPSLAYCFSDEINLLFLKTTFFKRIEKIDSIFAGYASTIFTKQFRKRFNKNENTAFDCRVIPLSKSQILKYLVWRQAEAFRNHNNAWAQYALIKKGLSPRKASKKLSGMKTREIKEFLLEKFGINLDKTPIWQKNGVLLYKISYIKKGFNPIKKEFVFVERKKVKADWSPPLFNSDSGKKLIEEILKMA